MRLPWLEEHIRDLKRRSVDITKKTQNGNILVLIDKEINLYKIECKKCRLLKKGIIDYNKISAKKSVEERLLIFMKSMRGQDGFFFVEKELVDQIIYGFKK